MITTLYPEMNETTSLLLLNSKINNHNPLYNNNSRNKNHRRNHDNRRNPSCGSLYYCCSMIGSFIIFGALIFVYYDFIDPSFDINKMIPSRFRKEKAPSRVATKLSGATVPQKSLPPSCINETDCDDNDNNNTMEFRRDDTTTVQNDVYEIPGKNNDTNNNNTIFPNNFLWGVATSAYQIEGSGGLDGDTTNGRGVPIWDIFSQKQYTILDQSNASIADDHYHLWKSDIALMSKCGHENSMMNRDCIFLEAFVILFCLYDGFNLRRRILFLFYHACFWRY